MKLRRSRSLAMFLAAVVALGGGALAATPAVAAPSLTWPDFVVAYNDPSTTSIQLTQNLAGSSTRLALKNTQSVVLDLAGHSLRVAGIDSGPGLGVPPGTHLTIRDSVGGGELTVSAYSSSSSSAGIGGDTSGMGTVRIESGTIHASGSEAAPAIGAGGSGGRLEVTGGTVHATGSRLGHGIGVIGLGSMEVAITGGTVTVSGGEWVSGIYAGPAAGGGSISIGADADVTTSGGGGGNAFGPGPIGTPAQYSSLSLAGVLTLAPGSTQIVPAGLTIPVTGALVNKGTITLAGTITGSVDNQGTIMLTGQGAIDPATVTGNNFVLTFDPANGTAVTTSRVYAKTFAAIGGTLPAAPTRTGYRFTGWAANGSAWTAATTLTADTAVSAQWEWIPVPFSSLAAVEIVGTAAVGSPLTATITTDAAPTPTSYTYQWLANGAPITEAVAAEFTPAASHLGQDLTVRATPVLSGYVSASGAGTSAPVTIGSGSFTSRATVTLSGTPAVGEAVTAQIATPAQPAASSYGYQWFADGATLPDAVGPTFTPTSAQYGAQLTVTAAPVLTGFTSSTGAGTSAPVAVSAGSFTRTASVAIAGTPAVGAELTASLVAAALPTPTSSTFQWYADGVAITDATGATFTPGADQFDAELTVTVTPVLTGYDSDSGAASSVSVTVGAGSFTRTASVALTGTPAVGERLVASVGTDALPTPSRYTFQWFADGAPITDAVSAAFYPTAAQLATGLTVTATPVLTGHASITGAGTSTAVTVTAGTFTGAASVIIAGAPTVGAELMAEVSAGTRPAATSYTYQWFADGTAIGDAVDATFHPAAAHLGVDLTVAVTPVLAGYVPSTGSGTSLPVTVAAGTFTRSASVAISGTAMVDQQLTATVTTGALPGPTSYAFQWLVDGSAVSGATAETFTPPAGALGAEVTVTATPVLAGYDSASGGGRSTAVTVAAATFAGALAVTIDGRAQVGGTVTAVTTSSLAPAATLSYAWFAGGLPLAGATRETLEVPVDAAGSALSVRVTASLSGYTGVSADSAASSTVLAAPVFSLSVDTLAAGESFLVSGTRIFDTGALTATLFSDPVVLGSLTPAVDGALLGSLTIPASTPAGAHHLVLTAADGTVLARLAVMVTAAGAAAPGAGSSTQLAVTGQSGDMWEVAFAAMLLLGAGLLVTARRRRA